METHSIVRRPHALADLLIIFATFGLLQFHPESIAALRVEFVTSSCRELERSEPAALAQCHADPPRSASGSSCHPPSLVVTMDEGALWFQGQDGRRFFATVSSGRRNWRAFLEVPENARSCPAVVRLDVGDDIELDTLVAVIDLSREVGFTHVQVAALVVRPEPHPFMRL